MKEIVLTGKKKGMAVLLGVIALYVLAILGVLAFCAQPWGARVVLLVLSIAVLALGWIPLCGLKVAGIEINRKMLSELAISDPAAFTKLVEIAKKA